VNWTPFLEAGTGPVYLRLVDALARDIQREVLAPGVRLPTQRELAYNLSVSIGTVVRAYEESARRGLVTAQVGRGTFVADANGTADPNGHYTDFSIGLPPTIRARAELEAHLRGIKRHSMVDETGTYSGPVGSIAHRQSGAVWMQWSGGVNKAPWQRVACTVGAQQGMDMALGAFAAPGESVLCEELTYWGIKALAQYRGNPLHGVAVDEQGLIPSALEEAALRTGARVLYCVPTLQNPTAAVMGNARRQEITDLSRKLDLKIIEDDIYSVYARGLGLEPLVNLAPERTAYVTSLSKAILPGLRTGYLLMPDEASFEGVALGLRASVCMPQVLGPAVGADWINSGRAAQIAADTVAEMAARTRSALTLLGDHAAPVSAPATLFIWLPLGADQAYQLVNRTAALGIALSEPDAPRVGAGSPHGVRIAIGGVPTIAALRSALGKFRDALAPPFFAVDRAIV